MTSSPTTILIDLDDCLYDYTHAHGEGIAASLGHFAARFSIEIETAELLFLEARARVHARLEATASAHSKIVQFKRLLDSIGLGSRPDVALELDSLYWGNFIRSMNISEGVVDFLEACRELGISVFVVTDMMLQTQVKKLVTLDLLPYFAGLISSEEVGLDKPSERFVSELQERFGAELDAAWVIGDNETRDGGLAEALGARFFLVPRVANRKKFFRKLTQTLRQSP